MVKVQFRYRDSISKAADSKNGKSPQWRKQECVVSSVEECKRIYGLDEDESCEYEILDVSDL